MVPSRLGMTPLTRCWLHPIQLKRLATPLRPQQMARAIRQRSAPPMTCLEPTSWWLCPVQNQELAIAAPRASLHRKRKSPRRRMPLLPNLNPDPIQRLSPRRNRRPAQRSGPDSPLSIATAEENAGQLRRVEHRQNLFQWVQDQRPVHRLKPSCACPFIRSAAR
jgi:hypothetical protein